MENLVQYLAEQLVDHPEDVKTERTEQGNDVTIELRVNAEDMGKVIGKQGRIAKSIRTLVKAAAAKEDKHIHYTVDIVE
ncbi:MAG: KH domain-containing protein [Christensenellales bacterium]